MSRKNLALLVPAVASALALMQPSPASAQNLLERLFGPPKRSVREFPPPPPPAQPQAQAPVKKAAKAAPKIQSPSYNTYKPDSVTRIDFSRLLTTAAVADDAGTSVAFAQQLAGDSELKVLAEKTIGDAVLDWYRAHPQPLWVIEGKPNAKAEAVLRLLGDATSYALSPADYAVAKPDDSAEPTSNVHESLRFEAELTARVLRYARDAHSGRINPNRISGYYDFPAKPVDYNALLSRIASGTDAVAALEAQHPSNREYRLLREELVALQSQPEISIQIDKKLLVKPGETSAELPKLWQVVASGLDDELGGSYGEALHRASGIETYGDDLVPLVKELQKRAGLKSDGVIGPRTVQALVGETKADREVKIRVALEQMRWLPDQLGDTRVFINQPAFTAAYTEDGVEKLSMRTVIGRNANQTSFFYDEIKQVDYNPYWGVPQSIIVNEMLPRLRNDPGYLDRAGYEVFNASGKKISSSSVDWGSYGSRVPYAVRQAPSEANALGELKILFPNKHAIYMHDTPQKALFDRDVRAFSHGCVRLAQPREMAAAVLGVPLSHVEDKLKKGHSMEKVTRKIPVYVAYFTAWPNKDGVIEYFDDIYGRDARLTDAVDKTERVRTPAV